MKEQKIKLKILKSRDEPALLAFLQDRQDSSLFLLGNLRLTSLEYQGRIYEGDYAAAFEDDRIIAVAAHYWNGNIVFQTPVYLKKVLNFLLEKSGREVMGLIGLADQVEKARKLLGYQIEDFAMYCPEGLYSLTLNDLVVPERLGTGEIVCRRMEERDEALLIKWRADYLIDVLKEPPGEAVQRAERDIKGEREEKKGWVAEKDGVLVSTSGFNATLPEIVQLGGVYTPPELRRNGYSRLATAQALLDVRREGVKRAVLFTDDENIGAIKVYTSLGFKRIGEFGLALNPGCKKRESV